MAGKHPLDISSFFAHKKTPKNEESNESKSKPQSQKSSQSSKIKSEEKSYQSFSPHKTSEPIEEKGAFPKIRDELWSQLNAESRKILSSRMWKQVDFNPMLQELSDLTKLTEKWLRWAIPTYVNGLKGGVIKDWLEGKRDDRDFHYILVGEHLKHLKEHREKAKHDKDAGVSESVVDSQIIIAEQKDSDQIQDKQMIETASEKSEAMNTALNELDENIQWFQEYINKKNNQNQET